MFFKLLREKEKSLFAANRLFNIVKKVPSLRIDFLTNVLKNTFAANRLFNCVFLVFCCARQLRLCAICVIKLPLFSVSQFPYLEKRLASCCVFF